MTGLILVVEAPWAQTLAWTLVHFLWQGALLALVLFLLLRFVARTAVVRYAISVAALGAMLLAPAMTWSVLGSDTDGGTDRTGGMVELGGSAGSAGSVGSVGSVGSLGLMPAATASGSNLPNPANHPNLPNLANLPNLQVPLSSTIVLVWLAGVIVLSLRLLGGWVVARRLVRRGVRPVRAELARLVGELVARLGIGRAVRVLESAAVTVPVTIGWLKPVVLLPAAALSHLSPAQVEALVAHELAHIRRHDYPVNLLQSIVETLLFYHPAVWWVSRTVRTEREHCCDDAVVEVCDRLVYVTALTELAARPTPQLALAATDGSLVARVRRLLGPAVGPQAKPVWLPLVVSVVVAGVLGPAVLTSSPEPVGSDRVRAAASTSPAASDDVLLRIAGGAIVVRRDGTIEAAGDVTASLAGGTIEARAIALEGLAGLLAQDPGERAAVAGALEDARRHLERTRVLFEVGLVSASTVAEAEAAVLRLERLVTPPDVVRAQADEALQRLLHESAVRQQIGTRDPAGTAADAERAADFLRREIDAMAGQDPARRAELERRLEEYRTLERQIDEQRRQAQRDLEDKRMALEVARMEARFQAEILALTAERDLLSARLAEVRKQFETGTANRSAVLEIETQFNQVAEQIKAVEAQRRLQQEELQLRRREQEIERDFQQRQMGIERMARDLEVAMAARAREMEAALAASGQGRDRAALADLVAAAERALAAQYALAGAQEVGAFLDAEPVTDPNEVVRIGDILAIEIAGEPGLPRAHVVLPGGAIRLPFLGDIRVVGLTAGQVQDAIRKQLTDRKLGGNAAVTVEIRRRR